MIHQGYVPDAEVFCGNKLDEIISILDTTDEEKTTTSTGTESLFSTHFGDSSRSQYFKVNDYQSTTTTTNIMTDSCDQSVSARLDFLPAQQVLFCAASLIQKLIHKTMQSDSTSDCRSIDRRDVSSTASTASTSTAATKYTEFNAIPDLPSDLGGSCHPSQINCEVFLQEMQSDDSFYEHVLAGVLPTIDTIFRFMNYVYRRAGYAVECNVIALIFLNRVIASGAMRITTHSWRALWTTAVIVAQKTWEDAPTRTSSFASILPSMSKELLRTLEFKLLSYLDFVTSVDPLVYNGYVMDLSALFDGVRAGSALLQRTVWSLPLLTLDQAARMEQRDKNVWKKPQEEAQSQAASARELSGGHGQGQGHGFGHGFERGRGPESIAMQLPLSMHAAVAGIRRADPPMPLASSYPRPGGGRGVGSMDCQVRGQGQGQIQGQGQGQGGQGWLGPSSHPQLASASVYGSPGGGGFAQTQSQSQMD